MSDLFRLAIVFVLIVILLRKKVNIGYVLLFSSALLAVLYLMPAPTVFSTVKAGLTNQVTIKLIAALTAIRAFEMILRENNILNEMMQSSRSMLKKKKAVIISMPLLIGLLPSIGGAYLSAPMVDESTKGTRLSQEEKGFINYWYRHPWECILPLYPGIVLASALSGLEMRSLILANLTYAVLIFVTGFLFSMRTIKGKYREYKNISMKGLYSFIPIGFVLLLVVLFKMELHYALLISMTALFVFFKYSLNRIYKALRYGISLDVILLILGTMLFKETMESSGAVKNISSFFTETGIPVMSMLFLLPFITGILTGITVGFVGSTFPLIMSLLSVHPDISLLGAISFSFASGFLGVLLSPVHVCLVLTREYFKADMWGMYKKMLPASLIVFVFAVAEYLIFTLK